ncbi:MULTISPECIES: PepSY-associated TM helix domain-containing protein [unclassified Variovorax]|jgi:uncharacterized iron-regulated membrane protein|uniref:PepSY-associated TM helix domain-containing protein n=1 Tax=unclassified Variovorax TaxID=663243 RepID=UPI000F7DEEB2|nr:MULTISPECIES: PepSY-associated TM helix domain-containing protein [unclassified Variovorax]RSZ42500.1 PepSY domain-containing protein [Variovorax sp. 553]RSZ43474.1 PepSY domain-containing protein [Variovorax sp. 679]
MLRRQLLLRLHRWMGLASAAFLVLAGLTGSLLAFEDELEVRFNPGLFVVAPPAGPDRPRQFDPFELRDMAQRAAPPQANVDTVILGLQPSRSLRFILSPRTDPETGRPLPLDVDELFMDPHTGAVLGTRLWGESLFRRETAVSFLYRLHYSLAMPAPWGARILGTVGLLWTLNCLVGLWLTFPRRGAGRSEQGWWRRWGTAWRFSPSGGMARVVLGLHRASGLWLWPAMLVFAWSSVMFNMRESVYRPVMSVVVSAPDLWAGVPPRRTPMLQPAIDWRSAHMAARNALDSIARQKGFIVEAERDLRLDRHRGVYVYRVRSSLDIPGAAGATTVLVDATTGMARGFAGDSRAGALEEWLGALHMARNFGTPYKALVALLGIGVALMSAAGLLVWYRRARARIASRRPGAAASPT